MQSRICISGLLLLTCLLSVADDAQSVAVAVTFQLES